MQPTTDDPSPPLPASKTSNPYSPKIFYSDSVGCSALRIILLHKREPICLGGAFQFQALAGQIIAKSFTFYGTDYDENSLHTVCLPAATHEPILFRVSATSPPLLDDGKEDVLYKRLAAIDFRFTPIKDAIVNGGFSAILLLTDPPPKIKPIESITGWTIFKPLPMYVPVELSSYYYMTNLVPESDKTNIYKFCQSVHHMWTSSNKSIAMIIGAKDSGKSTISKELCNVLLSTKPHITSTIYYLDCDVGQSEFTPPGLISIVKIDKPILSAPFATQFRTFHNSYYYGDISPGGDLDLYISILKQCFTEFFEISQHDANALLLINTLGWVENFGKEILDNLVKIFAPGCILALKRGYIHVPSTAGRVFFHDAHIVPDNRKISAPKLRDLAITGYFTQCFLKSMNLEVVSFSDVSVRMVSFEKIGIFIHPSHLISSKAYLAALNMSTVALCTVPKKFKNDFKWQKLCDKENLPYKIEYSNAAAATKPFFKCIGYGLVRAISIEKEKIYIITPTDPELLMDVNVLAIGNDIHTPHWIFQTQNSANAPYLMHTKNQANDFDRLSMPLKIIGMHKRNVFRNR